MTPVDRFRFLVITGFGLGLSPLAPGTVGTLGGAVLAVLIQALVGPSAHLWDWGAAAVLLAFGCTTTSFVGRTFKHKDPGAFVLDEVVGYLVAVALYGTLCGPLEPTGFAVAFVLFRAFDVLKVQPAKRLEEIPGAVGIMLDDVAAGLYAGALLLLSLPYLP